MFKDKPNFIAPNAPKNIIDQAKEAKANAKFKMIEAESTRMYDILKQAIIEADIEVGDYKTLMEAVVDKMANFINTTINAQRLNNFISNDKEEDQPNQEEDGEPTPEANN